MKKLIFIGITIVASLLWFKQEPSFSSIPTQVTAINGQDFDSIAEKPETFVLDVHTPEQQHISGTDAFIPYNEIAQNLDKLPQDKNTPILVYCRSGSMSKTASKELVNLGYTTVYDLQGGINAYRESHVEVTLTPPTHLFGTVVYGEIAHTDFTLTNFTPTPLTITSVSGSCSCTQPYALKTELKPYESTTIEVDFDPSVHKDDSDLGDVTRTVFVETDNPNFPRLSTTITAKVVKE